MGNEDDNTCLELGRRFRAYWQEFLELCTPNYFEETYAPKLGAVIEKWETVKCHAKIPKKIADNNQHLKEALLILFWSYQERVLGSLCDDAVEGAHTKSFEKCIHILSLYGCEDNCRDEIRDVFHNSKTVIAKVAKRAVGLAHNHDRWKELLEIQKFSQCPLSIRTIIVNGWNEFANDNGHKKIPVKKRTRTRIRREDS